MGKAKVENLNWNIDLKFNVSLKESRPVQIQGIILPLSWLKPAFALCNIQYLEIPWVFYNTHMYMYFCKALTDLFFVT